MRKIALWILLLLPLSTLQAKESDIEYPYNELLKIFWEDNFIPYSIDSFQIKSRWMEEDMVVSNGVIDIYISKIYYNRWKLTAKGKGKGKIKEKIRFDETSGKREED